MREGSAVRTSGHRVTRNPGVLVSLSIRGGLRWLPRRVQGWLSVAVSHLTFAPDLTDDETGIYQAVAPYSMTTPERVKALVDSVEYIEAHRITGAVVECGVWRGGSMMAVARRLMEVGSTDRDLYLYDTFSGMPDPADVDRDYRGRQASAVLARTKRRPGANYWCIASIEDVRANMLSTGYPAERLHLIEGLVEDTVPGTAPGAIALLRLDTDWYSSTLHELECLYPRVAPGGIVIIDDYGHWAGARKAVDQFIARLPAKPLLHRIDYSARIFQKPSE